jgi:diguanylate cyclase
LLQVDLGVIALAFFHNAGLVALVVLAYGSVLRRTRAGMARNLVLGLLFGAGVHLAMSSPIMLTEGVVIDGRAVFVALSTVFAGWPGAMITASIAALHRFETGGIGATAGLCGIVWVMVSTIAVAEWRGLTTTVPSMRRLTEIAFLASLMPIAILLMPSDLALTVFLNAGLPLAAATFGGVLAFGHLLAGELQRHEATVRARRDLRTDALTGLQNRRGFDDLATHAFYVARSEGQSLALVMIDIDHFKRVNDIWGHAAGDKVLAEVSEIIAKHVRVNDTVCRFGGEEIAVLMPHASLEAALSTAERVRIAIEEAVFLLAGIQIKVTVSAGASCVDESMTKFGDLFDAADKALYSAKSAGRNRVKSAAIVKAA